MNKMHISYSNLRQSERGMISIMTTMILMIVISLIVLGFAQISRRNQRESLDRQLSTQAFYAAESGINDVRELIQGAVAAGTAVPGKTGCTDTGPGAFYASLNPDLDAAKNVKYSCMLVDPSPTRLRFSNVGTTSIVVPLVSAGGNFSQIRLDWQSKLAGSPVTGCPATTNNVFSATGSWSATCGFGVLRFDLVPASGALNADSLRNATMTTFAVPFRTGGATTVPYAASAANTNNRAGVRCTTSGCNLSVTGLSQSSYYMRITSLYRDVSLQISATNGGGAAIEMEGAQAVIDATGKAQDVLRRVQVNVPLRATSQNELSDYAIQSTDSICKRFAVMNGYFDNNSALSGVTSNSGNRLCTASP
ncbi:MAG: pilus assembly PilX N-terminal domain-containing protein [Patescibacteria group bacterium]